MVFKKKNPWGIRKDLWWGENHGPDPQGMGLFRE